MVWPVTATRIAFSATVQHLLRLTKRTEVKALRRLSCCVDSLQRLLLLLLLYSVIRTLRRVVFIILPFAFTPLLLTACGVNLLLLSTHERSFDLGICCVGGSRTVR